jgi:hypothetical protein
MAKEAEKQRRMARRIAVGNRVITPVAPVSRVRAAAYLVAHACFNCRKSFKHDPERSHSCPGCGGKLHWMARSFRAPKATNREQWRKVQTLYALGFRFDRYGSYEGERFPASLRAVAGFVARNPKHPLRVASIDESLLPK